MLKEQSHQTPTMQSAKTLSPLITAEELLLIHNHNNLVLIDASASKNAKQNYQDKHLKGALFVDLNTQLAAVKEDAADGGRHPLPSLENFALTLISLGISKDSHVVIYDDMQGSNAAARFWWMLTAAGHEKVQVLNGGLNYAIKMGFPSDNEVIFAKKDANYGIEKWQLPMSNMQEVEQVAINESYTVIDVRSNERYLGKTEPIDLIAGHIPGAINIPFTTNLDEHGLFLSPAALKSKYDYIFTTHPSENIIVHCGSGVTACHTLLAMAYAGFEIPKLYVGSWSEWSRNKKPIATEI